MHNEEVTADLKRSFDQWHEYDSVRETYAKKHGISRSLIDVLAILQSVPEECTQKFLIEHTLLPKQTINSMVTSLSKQGMINLTESTTDRRRKNIQLTPTGKVYAQEIVDPIVKAEYQTMAQMPAAERQQMITSLDRYIQAFAQRVNVI